MRLFRRLAVVGFFVCLWVFTGTEGAAAWFGWGGTTVVPLDLDCGTVEVALAADNGRELRLKRDGRNRWVFDGSTAALVGGSYSIVLRNRTPERLKIVVGVDGLNVYRRKPVVGRSDGDVGSIVGPWGSRTLSGWQLDHERAQRFVFSPPEWSEGRGRTDSEIGLITVQVYRERPDRLFDLSSGDGVRAPEPGRKSEAESRSLARPRIGTSSGDDVASRVRSVYFDCRTIHPEAWVEIDYGNHGPSPPRIPPKGVLGIEVKSVRDGSVIVSVVPGSPAEQAGLRSDDVIVAVDTRSGPSPTTLRRVLRDKESGDHVFLRVRRGEHELALKIRV